MSVREALPTRAGMLTAAAGSSSPSSRDRFGRWSRGSCLLDLSITGRVSNTAPPRMEGATVTSTETEWTEADQQHSPHDKLTKLLAMSADIVDGEQLVAYVVDDLSQCELPPRSRAAAQAVPTPPIRAVLACLALSYLWGEQPREHELLRTMTGIAHCGLSDMLHFPGWAETIAALHPADSHIVDPDVIEGLSYLMTWFAAIIDGVGPVVEDLVAEALRETNVTGKEVPF